MRLLCRRSAELFDVPEHRRADTAMADDLLMRAAMSNSAICETFSVVITNKLIQAAKDEPDTTRDWVYVTSAVNFLSGTLFSEEHSSRLERHTKGRPAQHMSFGSKGEPFAI